MVAEKPSQMEFGAAFLLKSKSTIARCVELLLL